MNTAQSDLLRSVSRSFYISIRLLPRALREPVGLAYLLARTTDTIADTSAVHVDLRCQMLQAAAKAIRGEQNSIAKDLHQKFLPLQQNPAERELIRSFADQLRWLENLRVEDQAEIRRLLTTISDGQALDLTRWREGFASLVSADELWNYTYMVAGCVGEFWTRICFRKNPPFARETEPRMLELGRHYGSGLQLVNILRDVGTDLHSGRCYFPQTELHAAGIDAAEILKQPDKFLPVYRKWIDEARDGLAAGIEYSAVIQSARVRVATSLPALIGIRTLSLLENRGIESLKEVVKVPRAEVRRIIGTVAITLASPGQLWAIFNRSRRESNFAVSP